MKAKHYNDTHQQALAYAAFDASDPFTYSRIMSHIASGLCDNLHDNADHRYKATVSYESRKFPPSPLHPEGSEAPVAVYRSIQRP
jgi:hypothetical protein